jgi:hypothetical protein
VAWENRLDPDAVRVAAGELSAAHPASDPLTKGYITS